jgi:hypothetical protein
MTTHATRTRSWQRLSTGELMTLWAQTPTTPMNVAVLGLVAPGPLHGGSGTLRLADLRAAVAERLDRAPALRRRIWRTHPGQGPPVWTDDPAARGCAARSRSPRSPPAYPSPRQSCPTTTHSA